MRILFTGGGTGGHVFPIVAIARALQRKNDHRLLYMGPDDFGSSVLRDAGIDVRIVAAGKIHRHSAVRTALELLKLPIGIVQAAWHLFIEMPDVVFSKGGYGAAPTLIVAWLYNIPIVLHDSDAVPGLLTRTFAKRAAVVFVSFDAAAENLEDANVRVVGHPVRATLSQGSRSRAQERWGIGGDRPVLLILGGSQGAQPINDLVLETLPRLLDRIDILHVVGEHHYDAVTTIVQDLPQQHIERYQAVDFMNEEALADAYALSTIVLSRAGAGTLFEIAYLGLPSILIPLPHAAADHQRANAQEYRNADAAIILEEENLEPNLLLDAVDKLLNDTKHRTEIGEHARNTFARPKAASEIASTLLTYE